MYVIHISAQRVPSSVGTQPSREAAYPHMLPGTPGKKRKANKKDKD